MLQKLKMINKNKKKAQIVVENVIFIILNLLFLSMLLLFVYSKSHSEAKLEEKYAKQIALIIDSAKPGMDIYLNMEDAIVKAESNGIKDFNEVAFVSGNAATVKLRETGGYTYYFFNHVDANVYPEFQKDPERFVIKIGDYK